MKATMYLFVAMSLLWAGCDLFGNDDDDPEIVEVTVVGTQIPTDFLQTGEFGITAVSLDGDGNAVLSDDVDAEVRITQPEEINPQVSLRQVNTPRDVTQAIALDIDASSSMAGTDPTRARVQGAKSLVDILSTSSSDFEVAVYEYSGSGARLLQQYTADTDSLNTALDRVGANGSTPTYRSLLTIMETMEATKPESEFARTIVLLSDGQPTDSGLRTDACAAAQQNGIPVYSIGLGPASDIDQNSQAAVDEMRAIADCSGAAYAGIDPQNVDSSAVLIFNSIGLAAAVGSTVFDVEISNSDLNIISRGDLVVGEIEMSSGGGSASATFSFRVP